jgi:hypothetical protein
MSTVDTFCIDNVIKELVADVQELLSFVTTGFPLTLTPEGRGKALGLRSA